MLERSNFLCLKDLAPGALGGFKQGEKFGYVQSNKYTPEEAGRLFKIAGLQEVSRTVMFLDIILNTKIESCKLASWS
ncbi:hypothetical protein RUND412_010913 [Rhizina undulata]